MTTPAQAAAAIATYRDALKEAGITGELADVILADYARLTSPTQPRATGAARRDQIVRTARPTGESR